MDEASLRPKYKRLVARKELRHVRRHRGQARERIDSRASEAEPQHALMLVKRLGLEVLLGIRTDNESGDLPAAMVQVGLISFIEGDNQQAARLKRWAGDQRRDIGLQPGIRLGETAIVGVVHEVGHDERILR